MSDNHNPIHTASSAEGKDNDKLLGSRETEGRLTGSLDSENSTDGMISKFEIEDPADEEGEVDEMPDMYALENIGLYCQYCAVGLLYGAAGTILPFCVYVKQGEENVCANARQFVFLAWNFKILFAILTEMYRPWGYKRKAWMALGWVGALTCLLFLAIIPSDVWSVGMWLGMQMIMQGFIMFSDVPADGYCVALGQMEPEKKRGTILATGQRLRFTFSMIAGLIQTFFLNGVDTSPPDCKIGISGCWSFGLSMQGYYALLFAMTLVLAIPIFYLKEIKCKPKVVDPRLGLEGHNKGGLGQLQHAEQGGRDDEVEDAPPTWDHFKTEIWDILCNQTTMYLLIYVIGFHSFGIIAPIVNVYLQFYVIKLTNFEAGIDNTTSYLALVGAVWVFQTYLMNVNWRWTQWISAFTSLAFSLLWIPAYYNSGGTMNAWYTIFVDLDSSFVGGLAQVLYSLSIIELAKPGLEATTYELVVTVGNACLMVNTIIGTQLLAPTKTLGCQLQDYTQCPSNTVALDSRAGYFSTDGPSRFTNYILIVTLISFCNVCVWVWFLPESKEKCKEWCLEGEKKGNSQMRGYFVSALCLFFVGYGFLAAFLLLDPRTSCLQLVGGSGC